MIALFSFILRTRGYEYFIVNAYGVIMQYDNIILDQLHQHLYLACVRGYPAHVASLWSRKTCFPCFRLDSNRTEFC